MAAGAGVTAAGAALAAPCPSAAASASATGCACCQARCAAADSGSTPRLPAVACTPLPAAACSLRPDRRCICCAAGRRTSSTRRRAGTTGVAGAEPEASGIWAMMRTHWPTEKPAVELTCTTAAEGGSPSEELSRRWAPRFSVPAAPTYGPQPASQPAAPTHLQAPCASRGVGGELCEEELVVGAVPHGT